MNENEKEIKLFFENKVLMNFEQEKKDELEKMRDIEREKSLFDKMSYKEKVKYKNFVNTGCLLSVNEISATFGIPLMIAGLITHICFSFNNISILSCFMIMVYFFSSSFVVFYSLYFLCNFIDKFIKLRPDFEDKVFYRINYINQLECFSKMTIKELNEKKFNDGKMLSLTSRNILRHITLNKIDIEKIKELKYELNEENDLLDFYFLVNKSL